MSTRIGRGAGSLLAVAGLVVVVLGFRGRDPGLSAGPTQSVSADPQLAINVNTSPVSAVDPRRPGLIVVAGRVDAPQLDCTLSVSTTGGEAWRRLDLPRAPGASNCFWPAVAFDGDGNLLVLYTPTGGQYNLPEALWLQRFTPELTTDGPPTRISGPLTFQPRLAVDGRRVLVAWIRAGEARATKSLGFTDPPNPLVVARSDDGGRTFSTPVAVSDPGRLIVQPTLLARPGGEVVLGALDLGDDRATYETSDEGQPGPPPAGPWRIVTWTSTDGGSTFGPVRTVAERVVPSQRVLVDLAPAPAFALDPARRRTYATWESGHDVLLSRSDDGGTTWSPPRTLGPVAGAQFLPGIGVAPDGRVDVAFYDRSRDPTDVLAEVVLASSSDGGLTFLTTRVSDRAFDSVVGSFNGEDVTLGSHVALVAGQGRTTVVWPDTARGNRVNNIVDLVSATVDVRTGRGARVPLLLAGTLLVAAAAGVTARTWPGTAAGRDRSPARRPAAWPRPPRRG